MLKRIALLVLVAAAAGCGTTVAYKVPVDEIARLAQTPPAQRSQEVRVVPWQPLLAPQMAAVGEAPPPVVVNPVVVVGVPAPVRVRPAAHLVVAPLPVIRHPLPVGHATHLHHGGGGGGGGAAVGAVAVVAAVGILALVAEAAAEQNDERAAFAKTFDGWVKVSREQTLNVCYDGGTVREIHLDELAPADLAGARYGYFTEMDGKITPLQTAAPAPPPALPPMPPPAPPNLPAPLVDGVM